MFSLLSAAQNPLQSKLEALQCHFTWDVEASRSRLLCLRDNLEDIGTEEGNYWLGHIYNLRGFIQTKLGFTDDAQSLFNKATEAFKQSRGADVGPWLVVNYGNLAWLHHHLGDQEKSQSYLMDTLMEQQPCLSQDELYPEIYAEKAWTLMKFAAQTLQAADCFQKAISLKPDVAEWKSSRALCLESASRQNPGLETDLLGEMRTACEQDPENMYLAVSYLQQRAKNGERVADEAQELARTILRNPVSSYSGIKQILRVYKSEVSVDEAIDLAEGVLEAHPDQRYLKRCATLCYKWKIVFSGDCHPTQSVIHRAIGLHQEVISLYPHSSLRKKIDLANIYARTSRNQTDAEQMYQQLLERDVEPADKQMIYNCYAKYLNFDRQDRNRSARFHMKAAEIAQESQFRRNSIGILKRIVERGRSRMCGEIKEFLENLQAV